MPMLARLCRNVYASEANDAYAHGKDAYDAHTIFQTQKTKKCIKNKQFEIFEFCKL
jgi:hypothetical protein